MMMAESFRSNLLTVFDVDVRRFVTTVLDGVAVTRLRAFAAQTGHLRTDDLIAEGPQVFEGVDRCAMAGNSDGR